MVRPVRRKMGVVTIAHVHVTICSLYNQRVLKVVI